MAEFAAGTQGVSGAPGALFGGLGKIFKAPPPVTTPQYYGNSLGRSVADGRETIQGSREAPGRVASEFGDAYRSGNVTEAEDLAARLARWRATRDRLQAEEATKTSAVRRSEEGFQRGQAANQAEIERLKASEQGNRKIAEAGRKELERRKAMSEGRARIARSRQFQDQATSPGTVERLSGK